ncbi:lantibiotic dehydratase [Streptomyces morookaense]|uniref:Lantibiotic dehydratase n=1 Tax=Streptomyces morookaense TaxID=1970 RepID=A0A7Y7BBA3_STRMO|nr:lantibiotic dehydratase [Streptomyces morookaense]NVK81986.1 lantibiotic dehydratase [Streptomyces morookaense]GHF39601.1 lantibiotic dehydratase [Streptomyces morookaense]
MTAETEFEFAGVALLRAAVLPLPAGREPGAVDGKAAGGERPVRERIAQLTADAAFMAAVSLASPSLAGEARRAAAGEPLKPKRLRRILVSLVKYRLRMTFRPTPFGFFAGVALAESGPVPVRELGSEHRSSSRPDAAWLDAVVDKLAEVPGIPERTRLVANDLHTVRDGRLVLLDFYDADGSSQLAHSVRMTSVVRCALECASAPLPRPELVERIGEHFPHAPDGAVARVVAQLVRGRFLLSDLVPPPDAADPLGHVLERLHGCDHFLAQQLREIRTALSALDAARPADRGAALAAVSERMRVLHPAENLVQTDLAVDARLVLPTDVSREVERAVTALWRTSRARPGSSALRAYHGRFLERYGTGRQVPLPELLDEARGLGLPEEFRQQPGETPEPHPDAERTDRVLGELFLDATRRAAAVPGAVPEVVLDDAVLRSLAPPDPRPRPASLEVGAEVVADSWEALCAGDFRLVLGANPGSPLAGATFSRFAPVLGERAGRIGELVRKGAEATADTARTACVAYRPRVMRSANVATVPQWLPHRIPLGVGPAAAGTVTDLHAPDLAVYADTDRLHLVDTVTGERVRPVSYSMLNPMSGHVPPTARFLLELGREGQEWCLPWTWGPYATAPVQPRVTYGRTVLCPARWLPDGQLTEAVGSGDTAWSEQVQRWRDQWGVPRHVLLTRVDHRIAVDLDDPLHRLVLEDELKHPAGLVVVEQYGGHEGRQWLSGPDGAHASEFVFPVVGRRTPGALQSVPVPVPAQVPDRAAAAYLPGGEWLYAKVYVPEALQPRVLAKYLSELADSERLAAVGVDSWFFLRYADPDPHLRLRFQGKPAELWSRLLPELRQWAERLRASGLAGRLVLDTYDPEIERYGGAAAIQHAERVFHADSAAVLEQLAASSGGPDALPPTVLAALGVLDVLTRLGTEDEALGWLRNGPAPARRGDVPRDRKKHVADLLDTCGRPQLPAALEAVPGLAAAWSHRSAALDALHDALAGTEDHGRSRPTAALSLAHMHCNRLLGPARDQETLAHATALEGLALHLSRKRQVR